MQYQRQYKHWIIHSGCLDIWATPWQNQQSKCAPSEDSDQPGHLPRLIRIIAVRSMGSYGPKLSSCGQWRLWSDWADAQADLSLRWAHTHFVGFVMSRLIWNWLENVQESLHGHNMSVAFMRFMQWCQTLSSLYRRYEKDSITLFNI